MTARNILITGGAGFIGSAIAARLAAQGRRVVIPTRRRERAKHLITLPTAEVIEADIQDEAALTQLMRGMDAVIHLPGILHSDTATPYGARFKRVHVELARKVAEAAVQAGVPRVLHMSALGADANGPSMYLRSKADGEAAMQTVLQTAVRSGAGGAALTIFRPAVVFGRGDRFLNLFATMQRFAPLMLMVKPHAKMQPVWVEDVAQAFVNALDDPRTHGKTYELAGPKVYALGDLMRYAGEVCGHARPLFALPDRIAYLQAWMCEFAPLELLSRDNLDSMKEDSVMQGAVAPELGIMPVAMESVVPGYLSGQSPKERYMRLRDHAGR